MKARHSVFDFRSLAGLPLFLLLLLGWLPGCDTKPKEVIPSYIRIDTFAFQGTGPDSTGYPTQRISDVWVYVNNLVVGIYELPVAKIPVLAEGNANISIQAGVYTDGVRKNRVYYPFYRSFETRVNLVPGETSTIQPRFSYTAQKKIPFNFYQDFEASDTGCFKGDLGTVEIDRKIHEPGTNALLYGQRYAEVRTLTAEDNLEFACEPYIQLKSNGDPVYLEFDYRSSCQINVGVKCRIGTEVKGNASDLYLLPNEKWTKIYVSLGEETRAFNTDAILARRPATFRFFLRTRTPPGANNYLQIDNIRLIN